VRTDSWLERRFRDIVDRTDLGTPQTQRHKDGARVDFYWPELGLVVETDGLRYHRTPAQQAADRIRDQRHIAAGLTPLRFTYEQVRYEPDRVKTLLQTVADQLRARILECRSSAISDPRGPSPIRRRATSLATARS
jgi:very-short-patch-repair endonuclease